MPMCVGMHMDFLSPKTYRLAQTGKVFTLQLGSLLPLTDWNS